MVKKLVILSLLFFSMNLYSNIYIYIANSGRKIISNFPPTDYKKIIKIIKTKRHFIKSNISNVKYNHLIEKYSRKHGVDSKLVKAIIKVESDFNKSAVSSKGAKGLMQLMEQTAKDYGVYSHEILDPEKNIEAGVKHLKKLLRKYNNLQLVLAAYNAGETKVDSYGGIPPYRETINYVKKVIRIYKGSTPVLRVAKNKKRRHSRVKTYYDKNGILCISNIPDEDN